MLLQHPRIPEYSVEGIILKIDHTNLSLTASYEEIDRLCQEALRPIQDFTWLNAAAVCVRPNFVGRAADVLRGTRVALSFVTGFPDFPWPRYYPYGFPSTDQMAYETKYGIRSVKFRDPDARVEVDMVANFAHALEGRFDLYARQISSLVQVCNDEGARLKVIFENCMLPHETIKKACYEAALEPLSRLLLKPGYFKTSTGYGFWGATVEDVKLMRSVGGNHVGYKPSGGLTTDNIASFIDALDYLKTYHIRFGSSSLLTKLVQESR